MRGQSNEKSERVQLISRKKNPSPDPLIIQNQEKQKPEAGNLLFKNAIYGPKPIFSSKNKKQKALHHSLYKMSQPYLKQLALIPKKDIDPNSEGAFLHKSQQLSGSKSYNKMTLPSLWSSPKQTPSSWNSPKLLQLSSNPFRKTILQLNRQEPGPSSKIARINHRKRGQSHSTPNVKLKECALYQQVVVNDHSHLRLEKSFNLVLIKEADKETLEKAKKYFQIKKK
jgi:hypothetical protein